MLLAYIPDLLESGAHIDHAFQLYEVLVEKWLERESRWVEPEALRNFSERLAVDLYASRQQRGAERIPRSELAGLAQAWNIALDEWQLSGRSLLNRDAEGHYKFAHRSIMEYLIVKRLSDGDEACNVLELTDQMKAFLWEMIPQHLVEQKPVSSQMKAFIWEMIQHHILMKQPLTFDATAIDLRGFRPALRSTSASDLQDDQVKLMLTGHNFFDRDWHKEGKGIAHLYELREKEGQKLVIDHATGLAWQKSGSSNSMIYAEAEKYIRELNNKRFAGYTDWRLPTLEEAMSLMEPKKHDKLYLDPVFDHNQTWIWTTDHHSASSAWVVGFYDGYCFHSDLHNYYYVRAVR